MSMFKKATRQQAKLKVGVDGPSGAGKSYGALQLARGIVGARGKIAGLDTENGSLSLYSNVTDFDVVNLPSHTPAEYIKVIDAAVAGGYDALVIDSLSHAWQNVLAAKEDFDRANPRSNSWTNWRQFAPLWEGLMQHILKAPIHVVATMRSKQAYEQVDQGGRKAIVKLGLQPQVREGAEYEFGLVFSVGQNHLAEATKDRTGLFANRQLDLAAPELHAELVAWMNDGAPVTAPVAVPAPAPVEQAAQALTRETEAAVEAAIAQCDDDSPFFTPELLAKFEKNRAAWGANKAGLTEVRGLKAHELFNSMHAEWKATTTA